jgi:uroporphyrin-III C-methyltransferase/precorrin-2 dehydrogenase/sirohydrochlorin ferrochelatase
MGYYAAFLDVTARRCLVVGGGEPALAKVRGLLEAGAQVTVVWDRLHPDLRALRVPLHERGFQESDLDGCFLVIDASQDEATGVRVSQAARDRGLPVNVLDRPALCTFIAPALVRRGPLQVAISTSGRSPFLAAHLRRLVERWLGQEWGPMVELTGRLRDRLRQAAVPLGEQTGRYARALGSPALDLLRAGRVAAAEAAIQRTDGHVALVGAGPGDPALLTVRAADLLSRADLVLYDALVDPAALAWCRPDAELVCVGKRGGRTSVDQRAIEAQMIAAARAGRFVVRLKGGDPFVFGRGGEEVLALAAAAITVEVVPGVSAATAAPALAGIPLTHRGLAASFAVVTARAADGGVHDFRDLAQIDTLVVMMPVQALAQVSAQLIAAGRSPACPVALVEAASTPRHRVLRARLEDIGRRARQRPVEGPALLVVGAVVNALAAASGSDQPVEDGIPGRTDAGRYSQLRVDGAQVGVHGAAADGELAGNLGIGETASQQDEHLELPRRQGTHHSSTS